MRSKCRTGCRFNGYSIVAPFVFLAAATAGAVETVVVTATRTEQPLAEVGQAMSVVDADAIARRQSDTVVDLLRSMPGVTIARNGGVGTSTAVFIRGAESDQTVALIDGVKLNDPSSPGGGFNFGNLLVGNITRVEVLRGSQSVLWGSQAIGGVVNLITAQPTEELTGSARAEYGWRDTRQLVGNVSQQLGPVAASIGVSDFHTAGISAFNERRGGGERDPYRNFGAHAKFNVALTDSVSLDLRGWYSNAKVDVDGLTPPSFALGDTREYGRTREAIGYAGLNFTLFAERLHNRLASAYTETQRNSFDPDGSVFETFDAAGRNVRFEYQGTLDVTDAVQATFGAESERSRFISASFGGAPTRGETRIDSGYGQIVARPLAGLTAIAGVRHDRHEAFGGKTTSSVSAVWTPNEGITAFRTSYSEGFKAPTLYQLQSEFGNSLLHPETARGWDAGITQQLFNGSIELSATGFRRDTRDLINFISCVAPLTGACTDRPDGAYDNVARARAQGLELALTLRPIEALQAQANYSYVDAQNRSSGSTHFGKDLMRRPRETVSALVDYSWPIGVQTGATFTHVAKSFDNAANTRTVEGYEIVDLRVAYSLKSGVELQARIENLLDAKYETLYRYGTPGRAAYAGVRLSY